MCMNIPELWCMNIQELRYMDIQDNYSISSDEEK